MEMTIPPTILRSQIDFGDRARTKYDGIETLGQSIRQKGLEVPICVAPIDGQDGQYLLIYGGRRTCALDWLHEYPANNYILHHATTGEPTAPGFLLKSEPQPEENVWMSELIENLHRADLDWRDEVKLLVKAFRKAKLDAGLEGTRLTMDLFCSTFGEMLGGYNRHDVHGAEYIYDELIANPEKFKNCVGIRGAYQFLLDETQKAIKAEVVSRSLVKDRPAPQPTLAAVVTDAILTEVGASADSLVTSSLPPPRPIVTINFTHQFKNCNSLDHMDKLPNGCFNHIITDPDYAVSEERLSSNSDTASDGIAQASVEASLADLQRFIPSAFRLIGPTGFFVFWYDLNHHEKLQQWCKEAGFAVQRWPLTWHVVDRRSNSAPQSNFCKNVEWAMICRKPGTTLADVQTSSVWQLPLGQVVREFAHPFAKPPDLWRKILLACCHPGESVFDPFMGAGSLPYAALRFGMKPFGCEINTDHFNSACVNLHAEYRRQLNCDVQFV